MTPDASWRGEIRAGLLIAFLAAAAGAPLGSLWALVVPHVAVVHAGTGRGYLLPNQTEDIASAGGDLVMIAVLLGAGVVLGIGVGWFASRHPLGTVLGLLGGGALGGAVALAVGHLLVHGDYGRVYRHSADYATVFQVRPYVRGTVDLVVLPLVALLAALAAQVVRRALTPAPRFGQPGSLSSGTAGRGPDPAREQRTPR